MYIPPKNNQTFVDALRIGQQNIVRYIFRHFVELPVDLPQSIISPVNCYDNIEIAKKTNIKLVISGKRGIGKTYIGYAIKKVLDTYFNCTSRLYDDFNPKSIGVNIETLALRYSSKQSPIIIVINEFDVIMDYALDSHKQMFDPRLCHARDKSELNNMLDKISRTPYVILVCTTEKQIDDLATGDKRSFLRYGRFDFYASIDSQGSKITKALDDTEEKNLLCINPNISVPQSNK
jgi:SpoVK/Ycf46/Vps4 family AAA+-type ATPase